MSTPAELLYFPVNGYWYDVEAPLTSGNTSQPQFLNVNAYVDFIPRVPTGFSVPITNLDLGSGLSASTAVPIATITGRLINGQLVTINAGDTAGVQLLSCTAPVTAALTAAGLADSTLIYDIRFRQVVYAEQTQTLLNFAIHASVDTTPVDITDPATPKLLYGGP